MLHDADVALVDVARPPGSQRRRIAALAGRSAGDRGERSELEGIVVQCAEIGVAGYVTTSGSADELVAAARGVAARRGRVPARRGGGPGPSRGGLANQRREPAGDARLTLREREILRLIDDGLSNKEIAQRLSLQTKTVKNHVSNILAKLGVANRAAAAAALRGSEDPSGRGWR